MTVSRVLLVGGLFYLVYCASLFLLQRQVLYPGAGVGNTRQVKVSPGIERVWLKTGAGLVEAWLIPGGGDSSRPGPGLIFAHGNGELIDFWAEPLELLSQRGLTVMLVEYPGFGRSEGKPTQESITEALVEAYDFLAAHPGVDSRRMALWGRSLGGGAVCALSSRRPAAALILLSTFTSVRAFATRFLVPPFLIRDPFDNLAALKDFSGPVLIAHGKSDRIIPFDHALRLHAVTPRSRLVYYDCGHNDCPPDWAGFFDEMEAFLREAGVLLAE